MKRIFCCVLVLTLIMCLVGCSGKSNGKSIVVKEKTFFEKGSAVKDVAEDGSISFKNGNFQLIFNPENYLISVKDLRNGFVWESNFTDNSSDTVAIGITKTHMLSQIIINYISGNEIKSANSYATGFRKGELEYNETESGIKVNYVFSDIEITVPVEYSLESDGLRATVDFANIKEGKTNKLVSVELLPYFGTTSSLSNKGYALVPDGSGAVINFDDKEYGIKQTYKKRIYGEDILSPSNIQTTHEQVILAPVFGMKAGDNGFVAVIENGNCDSFICASAAGQTTQGTSVYSIGVCRTTTFIDVTMQNGSVNSSLFYNDDAVNGFYSVKYTMLYGDDANYVGMAKAYRKHLEKSGFKASSDGKSRLFVDLHGGILKQSSFLGIPYQAVNVLTSVKDAKNVLETLKKNGVDGISLGLKDFTSAAIECMAQNEVSLNGKLGSKKEIGSFIEFADKNNISVYPTADFFDFKESGNGIGGNGTRVYSLERSPAKLYDFTVVDNYRIKQDTPSKFIRPEKYSEQATRIIDDLKDSKFNKVGLINITSRLTSDYSNGFVSRAVTKQYVLDAVKKITAEYGTLCYAPNDYLWNGCEYITDIPTCSSNYTVFSYDVPFIQTVLKGYKNFSGTSLNLSGMTAESFLKCIETGSDLKFEGICSANSEIKGTRLVHIYGANFESWKDTAADWYKEIKKFSDKVGKSEIVAHTFSNNVATVKYSNGTTVYINYGKEDTERDGVKIPAQRYVIGEER